MNSLEYLGAIGVGKGWMISYRHMCRWNSGFFYRHPKLRDYDWYWRVEPDVSSSNLDLLIILLLTRARRSTSSVTLTTMYSASWRKTI